MCAPCSSPMCISARVAARPSSCSSISCATTMPRRSIWSATSSTAGDSRRAWYWPQTAQRRRAEAAAQGAQGRPRGLRAGQPRRVPARLRRHAFRRHRGAQTRDIHEAADGRRLLVIHGDQFDVVVQHARWLAHLGDWAYSAALDLNTGMQRACVAASASPTGRCRHWAKLKVKNAVNFIGDFEETLAPEATRDAADGRHLRPHPLTPRSTDDFGVALLSIAATGSKAAPRSSSITTAVSRSSAGADRAVEALLPAPTHRSNPSRREQRSDPACARRRRLASAGATAL